MECEATISRSPRISSSGLTWGNPPVIRIFCQHHQQSSFNFLSSLTWNIFPCGRTPHCTIRVIRNHKPEPTCRWIGESCAFIFISFFFILFIHFFYREYISNLIRTGIIWYFTNLCVFFRSPYLTSHYSFYMNFVATPPSSTSARERCPASHAKRSGKWRMRVWRREEEEEEGARDSYFN